MKSKYLCPVCKERLRIVFKPRDETCYKASCGNINCVMDRWAASSDTKDGAYNSLVQLYEMRNSGVWGEIEYKRIKIF